MKSKAKRFISLIVTLVMVFTVMSMTMVSMTAGAASTNTYSEYKTYQVKRGNQNYRGYILVPEKEGKYPVTVVYCGTGGLRRWKQYNFLDLVNKWINNGYIKPSILVMPAVDKNNSNITENVEGWQFEQNVREQLGGIKEALLASEYSAYIDPRKDIAVSGYSMGGAAALLAGTVYPNLFHNIGALSASHCYFTYDHQGWLQSPKQIIFSKSSKAKRLLAYSKDEKGSDGRYVFAENAKRYETEARNNGYRFKTYVTKGYGHEKDLFYKEIFIYLYYLEHNTVLTDSRMSNMSVL